MAIQRGLPPELILQAQDGDPAARDQVLRTLEPVLKAFFIKRIGYRTVVDDLVQNTMLRVHGGLEALNDPSRMKAFAMKAALFELHDYYRGRYSPKELLYDPGYPPEHAEPEVTAGSRFDAERALAQLTPRARRILELREYGYRYQEIAEMIGTSEAAVKMQVKRAFDKMRRLITAVVAMLFVLGGGL